jgi:hypothetical protein
MNCSKKTTELKVSFIVPLLSIVEDNKRITELLRNAMPLSNIGDDYVRSVRKVWKDAGRPEDWKIVLKSLKGSHHKKVRISDQEASLFPAKKADQDLKAEGLFTEHEIERLKQIVVMLDLIAEEK